MTDAEIETLKKLADEQEWDATRKRNYAASPGVRGKPSLLAEADKHADQAAALRSAVALAEQARSMEEISTRAGNRWEIKWGELETARSHDGTCGISHAIKGWLNDKGEWSVASFYFPTLSQALAAANAAMKAGALKTKDGADTHVGMTIYFVPGNGLIWVCEVKDAGAVFWNGRKDVVVDVSECYSTNEHAQQAAMKAGKA